MRTLTEFDGPVLSHLLHGKELAEVLKTEELLVIKCMNGDEIRIAWVDENGRPVKGKPAIAFFGRDIVPRVTGIVTDQRKAYGDAIHKGPHGGVGNKIITTSR